MRSRGSVGIRGWMVTTTILLLNLLSCSHAWCSLPSGPTRRSSAVPRRVFLAATPPAATSSSSVEEGSEEPTASAVVEGTSNTTSVVAEESTMATVGDDEEEEEEDYEYIEYEDLVEDDFLGSEWLVGTNFNGDGEQIKETWVRLAYNKEKNIAVWGDNSEGKWNFDRASQFLSISKDRLYGKSIWAGVVDDYYFLQGTVRAWTYLTPAAVEGQWQAKRLGQDPDELGTAPWFEEKSAENDDDDEEESEQ